jgi:hypothetical protein
MKAGVLSVFLFVFCISTYAQEIPLGGWQTHFSYLSGQHIEQVGNRFFCATYNGLFSYDPEQDSVTLYSKINGLHDTGISSMAYEPTTRLLLLSYRSGNLDLVYLNENAEPEEIIEWPLLRDTPRLPANRRSSQIIFHEGLAYVSTAFGIVVLDPKQREVRENYRYIGPSGAEVAVSEITFSGDSLYASTSSGILGTSMNPAINRQFFGNWQPVPVPFPPVAITAFRGDLYTGRAGQGIFRRLTTSWQIVYPSNSQRYTFRILNDRLVAVLDSRVIVLTPQDQVTAFRDAILTQPKQALLDAANTIWIADGKNGLVTNYEGAYRSYSPPTTDTTITNRTDSIIIDRNGLQWIRLPSSLGGGILVKNPSNLQQRYLSTSPNNGGLPSSLVRSLSIDRDGLVWFAGNRGVGYFLPQNVLSNGSINAMLPIFGQRRLLSNEVNTSIITEPGNRKWVGTRNGLYLFNPNGTQLIRQFDTSNSPLPSDQILALYYDEAMGRLYCDTPQGMVSYRSDATTPEPTLSTITIFPNPVRPGYGGLVGFKGLMDGTIIKITDLSGKLLYETRSQGGTASWNLLDYTGRRARGGIYLVLLVAPDGAESNAGKLAIVE